MRDVCWAVLSTTDQAMRTLRAAQGRPNKMCVGTAEIPVEASGEFDAEKYFFTELGTMKKVIKSQEDVHRLQALSPVHSLPYLTTRGLGTGLSVYVLYLYHQVRLAAPSFY